MRELPTLLGLGKTRYLRVWVLQEAGLWMGQLRKWPRLTSGRSTEARLLETTTPSSPRVAPWLTPGGAAAIVRCRHKPLFWTAGVPMSSSPRDWQVFGTLTEKRRLRSGLAHCRGASGAFSFLADSVPPLPSTLRLRGLGAGFLQAAKGRPEGAE